MSGWTTTSIAPRFLVGLLADAGQPVNDILAGTGITRAELETTEVALPLDAFRALWARAAAVQPDIGLTLVGRFPAGQMHILAHLALRSATVGAGINDLCRYAAVTSTADQIALEQRGKSARLSYQCHAPGPPNPWMAEHYFSMAVVFLTQATGRALPIRAVEFAAPAQAAPADYQRRFGVAPQFEADGNVLVFDAEALSWPLQTHDPYLHGILERVATSRRATTADAVIETARRAIANGVLTGDAPTLDEVAAACQLGTRALRARFTKSNTTFRRLLDDVRRDLARDHLDRGMSVVETAYLLGFSEPAAFQHACRRWFAKSAGDVRRESAGRGQA